MAKGGTSSLLTKVADQGLKGSADHTEGMVTQALYI